MSVSRYRRALAPSFAFLCLGLVIATGAAAKELPPQFDPVLSLTGNCATPAPDLVPDPSCPYPSPPGGPSGRFDEPRSIAIDTYGNEYVASYAGDGEKGRIDIFDAEGFFVTELLDSHGPKGIAVDSDGNLYVFEQVPGGENEIVRYAPSLYEPKAGNIEYANPRVVVATPGAFGEGGLAVDLSSDRLFVDVVSEIREYGSAIEGNKLLNTIGSGRLTSSNWIAVDAERRRLYASSCRESGILDCVILVFEADAPYSLLKEIDGSEVPAGEFKSTKGWTSIAVNEENGHFFVDDLEVTKNVYEFDENYEFASKLTFSGFQGGNALQIALSNSPLNKAAFNRHYLFVPVVIAAGRALAFEPPGVCPPEVLQFMAANISETEAELQATVEPCGGDTSYILEYTTQQAFEEGGFADALVAGEGTTPGTNLESRVSALISGLAPATAYRFRIQVENEAGEEELQASFTTYSDAVTSESCPNQALRSGVSAALPDCRAYELVTPPDTNGHPPQGAGTEADRFGTVESSPLGSAISFEIIGGTLPGTEGAGGFHGDLYRSDRGPTGWATALSGPSGTEATKTQPGSTSPDQGYAFWVAGGEGSAVLEGVTARYVRYPDGHSELIGRGSLGTDPEATGRLITENGTHIVFQTDAVGSTPTVQLETDAPASGTNVVYDRTADEVTHVVSLLPGNITPAAGENATYLNASADGNGIAFEIGSTLYLRKDNAVTYEIGTGVTFAGVSEGGERIFYVEGGDLLAFDTETEEVVPFSETGDVTPVNVAPSGTRAYFVSPSVLGEENPNGAFAQAGKENLYLSEEGQISFVGTVTKADVDREAGDQLTGLGAWVIALEARAPGIDPSRLSANGRVLIFQSRAGLDGQETGGFPQIYRYDAAANRLQCLSCAPTGVPQGTGSSLQSFAILNLDAPFRAFGFVPNLRADGSRAFFESTEPLVSGDVDEVQDVYEWEGNGVGSCTRTGGCIYLITSGHSARDNYLYGQSASGDDVFFTTTDVLSGLDGGGTLSIYDAKVDGGFADAVPPICEGEGCRGGLGADPRFSPPTTVPLGRSGNLAESRSCPKGKRKVKRNGKVRCVKKHRKHHRNASTKKKGGAK